MRTLVLSSMRGHARRYVAGALAIVLGVAFVAAALIVLSSTNASLQKAAAAPFVASDLVVEADQDLTAKDVAKLEGTDGVAAIAPVERSWLKTSFEGRPPSRLPAITIPDDEALRWQELAAGRMPRNANEIVVGRSIAADRQVESGTKVRIWGADETSHELTVVGVSNGASGRSWDADVQLSEAGSAALAGGDGVYRVLIRAENGVAHDALQQRVAAALGAKGEVLTGAAAAEQEAIATTGGVDILGMVLLGFAGISVFVAGLVVANTFTIVLAQRTRELALLRCVGANRRQVLRGVLVESFAVGTVASIVGVAVGTALAALITFGVRSIGPDLQLGILRVTPTDVLVPMAVGLVTTVLAALLPARKATRVPPLAALRPELAVAVRSRAGVLRLVAGALLALGGGAVLVVGALAGLLPIGMGGGLVSFLGVLLLGPVLAPLVVRLIGALTTRLGGVPARVAATNAVRNPGRTAATSAALLVGVTLIVMMSVGALSVQRTVVMALASTFPLDLQVGMQEGSLPARTNDAVRAVDGLAAVTEVRSAAGTLAGRDARVIGVDPAAAAKVLHDPSALGGLRDGVAVIPTDLGQDVGITDGERVEVVTKGGAGTFRARLNDSFGEAYGVVLTPSDLARVAPDARTALWARVADGADTAKTVRSVNEAVGTSGAEVDGGASERAGYDELITILLLVSTGLLAVAVLIALVGVGNTLSLSVLERIREQALLRALGLTRAQLRRTLAGEALLVASVAVLLGIPLGVAYGFAGATTLLSQAAGSMAYAVPWGTLALVAAVALVAGLLASVLPARRAVRVKPATALADE